MVSVNHSGYGNYWHIPYSGKVWQGETLAISPFLSIWRKKVWRMNSSANRLSIVTTNLYGFSLANHRRFAKFVKLSPCQTFPLYGIPYSGKCWQEKTLVNLANQFSEDRQKLRFVLWRIHQSFFP